MAELKFKFVEILYDQTGHPYASVYREETSDRMYVKSTRTSDQFIALTNHKTNSPFTYSEWQEMRKQ